MSKDFNQAPESEGRPKSETEMPSLVATPSAWTRLRSGGKRRILRACLLGGAVYVLVFTFVWDIVIGEMIHGLYTLVHLGTPKEDTPNFRPYVYQQPGFRALCDFGNWVADRTHPVISDDVMIAHWQQHHKEWEAALARKPLNGKPEDYRAFERHLNSIGLEKLDHYDPDIGPERFAIMTPLKSLGENRSLRPCTAPASKGYRYFPEKPPLIIDDQVVPESQARFALERRTKPTGALLVDSTDSVHYTNSMRPLSTHWFLNRWD